MALAYLQVSTIPVKFAASRVVMSRDGDGIGIMIRVDKIEQTGAEQCGSRNSGLVSREVSIGHFNHFRPLKLRRIVHRSSTWFVGH